MCPFSTGWRGSVTSIVWTLNPFWFAVAAITRVATLPPGAPGWRTKLTSFSGIGCPVGGSSSAAVPTLRGRNVVTVRLEPATGAPARSVTPLNAMV